MPFAPSKRISIPARILALHFAFIFFVGAFAPVAHAEKIQDIHPTGYVTDLANIVAPDAKARLEALCFELEQKTGAQMAIVTVRSLDGRDVDQYGNDLFSSSASATKKIIAAFSSSSRPPNAPTASK